MTECSVFCADNEAELHKVAGSFTLCAENEVELHKVCDEMMFCAGNGPELHKVCRGMKSHFVREMWLNCTKFNGWRGLFA